LPVALNAGEPRAVGHHAPRFILAASSRAAIVSIGQEQRTLFVSARRLVRESRAATHWRLLRERRVVRAVAPVACTFVGVMSNYAVAPDVDRCFTLLLDPRLPRALNAGEPRAVGRQKQEGHECQSNARAVTVAVITPRKCRQVTPLQECLLGRAGPA
jgi:poly(A) polymerase Pap1